MTLLLLLWACGATDPADALQAALEQVGSDPEAAAQALDGLCDAGEVDACTARASLDVGAPEAVRRAAERACEASVAAACVTRSEAAGDRWDQAACAASDADACLRVAQARPDEAARYTAQACHLGHREVCLEAAAASWRAGELARAVALADVRCVAAGAGDVACGLTTRWRAIGAQAEACRGGATEACMAACDAGMASLCDAAQPGYAAACTAGQGAACRQLALQAPSGVEAGLWRACDEVEHVDAWACLLLAERVASGAPLPSASRGDVAWLRNQACDLQLDYACVGHADW